MNYNNFSKKTSIKFTIILFFLFCFTNGWTQTKTVYQNKVDELTINFLKQLGVTQSQINNSKDMGGIEALAISSGVIKKLNTIDGRVAFERFNNELKKAEKLKTAVDFKNDKIRIEKLKKEELVNIKHTLRIKDSLEKEKNFKNSDFFKLKNNVNERFENWLTKKEFEKEEDCKIRIENQSQAKFDEINIDEIRRISIISRMEIDGKNDGENNEGENNEIDDSDAIAPDDSRVLKVMDCKLLKYNTDKEFFPVEFTFNNLIWYDSLKVPLIDAEKFKDSFTKYKISTSIEDWVLVKNNLFPSKINLINSRNSNSIILLTSIKNQYVINFSAKDFGFNQPELKNVYFKLTEYYLNKK